MESTITASSTEARVTVGVDTHKQFHVDTARGPRKGCEGTWQGAQRFDRHRTR